MWNAQTCKRLSKQTGEHFDTVIRGLVLRVRASGHATWCLFYRRHGRLRRWTIGRYDDLPLKDARDVAEEGRRRVAKGQDPASDRKRLRAAEEARRKDSIEALADAYLEGYAKTHKRSWRKDQTMLTCEIVPAWKGRAVTSIARRDCRTLVQAIAERGPTYATAVARLLSKMFSWAVEQEWIEHSPATRLIPRQRPDHDHEDQQGYGPGEIRRIWANTENLPPCERAPIRLGFWTGQRPTEISDMQWSELAGHWWRISGKRTKNGRPHRIYLVQQALDELVTVPRIEDEPYVFVGRRGAKQLGAVNVKAFAGVREREKPRHALRHSTGTGMASIGISKDDRAKVLNHVDQTVTGIYDEHDYDKEKRLALTRWSRKLQAILEQQETAKVVEMVARR